MNLRLLAHITIFVSILCAIVILDHSLRAVSNFYTFTDGMESSVQLGAATRAQQKGKEYTPKSNYFSNLKLDSDIYRFLLRNEFKRTLTRFTASEPLAENESELTTFYINAKPEDLDLLNSNLPESGKANEVDALLRTSETGDIRKIKLRYRGDMNYHWLYKKKSLRIKFEDGLYGMNQKINLINPPFLHSFRDVANYQVSKELGLLSPGFHPVRVFLNHEFMGVYIYLDQIDESFLRENKRMPGSIYFGDGAPYNDEQVKDLWGSETYWDKKAARNAEQKSNREDIQAFVQAVQLDNAAFYDFFETMMDKEAFLTFMALDRLTGTYHHDYNHNHKIYFDPYKGQFEPIQWDLNNWNNIPKKDLSLNPLLLKVKENPLYDAAIDKIIFEFYKNKGLEKLISIYKKSTSQSLEDIRADKNRDAASPQHQGGLRSWYSVPFTIKEFEQGLEKDIQILQSRKSYILDLLNKSKIEFKTQEIQNKSLVTFKVQGNSPISLSFPNGLTSKVRKIHKGKQYNIEKIETLYSGRDVIPVKTELLKLFGNRDVTSSPEYYVFEFDDINDLKQISYSNYVTGNPISVTESSFETTTTDGFHSWSILDSNTPKTVKLSGEIVIDQSLEFAKNETVEISPGTTFLLAPDQSIFFFGKVLALGTEQQPISFLPKDKSQPWGAVTVQGKSASGSLFSHIHVESGSITSKNLINYTAPFNIHDVDWFEVKNCYIGKNYQGDDAMHIAYAKGTISNCVFQDARSDALDVDIADVVISDSIFSNSGNDGLDLMTSTAKLKNNIYINTGDKGVSVGEWSDVSSKDSLFVNNLIGLEVKDRSEVTADNLLFFNASNKAINLYNKNSRYDKGGNLQANNVYFSGNSLVEADNRSSITIENEITRKPVLENENWYPTYLANKELLNEIDSLNDKQSQ